MAMRAVSVPVILLLLATAAAAGGAGGAGNCNLLRPERPLRPAGGTLPDTSVVAYRLLPALGCWTAIEEDRLLVEVPSSKPRRLGDVPLLALRPGDRLLLPRSDEEPAAILDARKVNRALASVRRTPLDPSLAPLRGPVPAGSAALQDLERVTQGVLTAAGTFDFRDDRPSDGAVTLRLLLRAAAPGNAAFEFLQSYERRGPGADTGERGIDSRRYDVRVLPAGAAVTVVLSDASVSTAADSIVAAAPVEMGVGDLLAIQFTLGYANRGGSENRGPVGVRRVAK